MKDVKLSYHVDDVFDKDIPALQHGNDGLIYTCVNTPYVAGTDPNMCVQRPGVRFVMLIGRSTPLALSGNLQRRIPSISSFYFAFRHHKITTANQITSLNRCSNSTHGVVVQTTSSGTC